MSRQYYLEPNPSASWGEGALPVQTLPVLMNLDDLTTEQLAHVAAPIALFVMEHLTGGDTSEAVKAMHRLKHRVGRGNMEKATRRLLK